MTLRGRTDGRTNQWTLGQAYFDSDFDSAIRKCTNACAKIEIAILYGGKFAPELFSVFVQMS